MRGTDPGARTHEASGERKDRNGRINRNVMRDDKQARNIEGNGQGQEGERKRRQKERRERKSREGREGKREQK